MKKVCFVVGPIGALGSDTRNHADLLLDLIIKPVMEDFTEFDVIRPDEDAKPGMIDSQVIIALRDSDLVIADLSFLNPNAFYEIGIRHMVSKPIIHMQLEDQRIPFDLSLYKTVPFSFMNPAAYKTARGQLKAQVGQAIKTDYIPDNPVIRALGQQHLKETASPEMKVVSDTLQSIQSRIEALEHPGSSLPGVQTWSIRGVLQPKLSAERMRDFYNRIRRTLPFATIDPIPGTDEFFVRVAGPVNFAIKVMTDLDVMPEVLATNAPAPIP